MNINIVYNRSNPYGLAQDAAVLTAAIRAAAPAGAIGQIHAVDPREPPRPADIQFHLEFPVYSACPWAHVNILLVNLDHYKPDSYNAYLPAFDQIWVRDADAAAQFETMSRRIARVIPWALPAATRDSLSGSGGSGGRGFVAFLGGSEAKAAATAKLIRAWQPADPPLRVYTTRADCGATVEAAIAAAGVGEQVSVEVRELAGDELRRLQRYYPGHLIASEGEGFGYVAAEAEAAGAFALMTRLPVFTHYYAENSAGVAYIDTERTGPATFAIRESEVRAGLDRAFAGFATYCGVVAESEHKLATAQGRWDVLEATAANVRQKRRTAARGRWDAMTRAMAESLRVAVDRVKTLKGVRGGTRHLPPVLTPAECPPISIVTLTYNRRKFIDLAFLNLMITDYPRSKIEWVVVEDSDDPDSAASDKIFGFAGAHPEIQVSYIPLPKKTPIGTKRNIGVERARHDIIVMMDDDDYYPETSLRRRVAWLTKGRTGSGDSSEEPQVAACTMLAMYDLLTGKSAVNVPPWSLPLGARISEASLTFRKGFWTVRPFAEVGMAEAENWLAGRESEVIEIPPQQIIVALSHGRNVSSRAVPADAPVSCFWGFEKELLVFLHGLAGVKVEEAKPAPDFKSSKATR